MMDSQGPTRVSAVILAAGLSSRMGQPKMVMPWKTTTIIGQVVSTVLASGIKDVIVVTGGAREQVEQAIKDFPVVSVYNPEFGNGEMLYSIQLGLQALGSVPQAALIMLGDQPQMELGTVRSILEVYELRRPKIIVPSYQMRRGHPWLIERALWSSIYELRPPLTMRNFMEQYKNEIHYLNVSTPTILEDLDTLDQYRRSRPLK